MSTNEAAADRPVCPCECEHGLASLRCWYSGTWCEEEGARAELKGFLPTPVVVEVLQHWAQLSVSLLDHSTGEMTLPTFGQARKKVWITQSKTDKNINFISDWAVSHKRKEEQLNSGMTLGSSTHLFSSALSYKVTWRRADWLLGFISHLLITVSDCCRQILRSKTLCFSCDGKNDKITIMHIWIIYFNTKNWAG